MKDKERILTYYSNAKELVKQNNPKAARTYVLAILNYALESYQNCTTILNKVKTRVFMDTWITVSRDLYDKGVTEFVLQVFGLANDKQNKGLQKTDAEKNNDAKGDTAKDNVKKQTKEVSAIEKEKHINDVKNDDEIDIAGLIEQSAKTQGWCAEVFEKTKNAVIKITASNKTLKADGTGVIISKKGYFITNDHVVFDEKSQMYCSNLTISFEGKKNKYKSKVLFSDKKSDIALCSFDPNEVEEFCTINCIEDYGKVKQGADCLIIGNAFGMGLAPFTGIIRFVKNSDGNIVYTAPSNPGDSGGPVLNRKGECIGINKSKIVAVKNVLAEGYAVATPMDKIQELLTLWCKSNEIEL